MYKHVLFDLDLFDSKKHFLLTAQYITKLEAFNILPLKDPIKILFRILNLFISNQFNSVTNKIVVRVVNQKFVSNLVKLVK